MNIFQKLKKYLKLGEVYGRSDLKKLLPGIDRHLKQLVEDGTLQKMARGLYYYPGKASFGDIPPRVEKLVGAFLKSNDFLLTSPNFYNCLGVGTTQLYNKQVVYNHKRQGHFVLGGKEFDFRLKQNFPKELFEDFLLVDLLNNLYELAEDRDAVLESVKKKMLKEPKSRMRRAINAYATKSTKVLFYRWIS